MSRQRLQQGFQAVVLRSVSYHQDTISTPQSYTVMHQRTTMGLVASPIHWTADHVDLLLTKPTSLL